MSVIVRISNMSKVAPFVGAWIEITEIQPSLVGTFVAPFVGAWIEIRYPAPHLPVWPGRSLRGSVD